MSRKAYNMCIYIYKCYIKLGEGMNVSTVRLTIKFPNKKVVDFGNVVQVHC